MAYERSEGRRKELVEAIGTFYGAVETAQTVAEDPSVPREGRAESVEKMWIAYKQLSLVSTPELAAVAHGLARKLNLCVWYRDRYDEPIWKVIKPEVDEFERQSKMSANSQ